MNDFKIAAEIDWDNAPDANEPSWAFKKAITLFNKWVSQCTVALLGPQEQATLLIQMVANALDEVDESWRKHVG